MKAINPTLLLMSLGLTTGILFAYYNLFEAYTQIVLTLCLVFLFLVWQLDQRWFIPYGIFPVLSFLCFIAIGLYGFQLKEQHFRKCHFQENLNHPAPQRYQLKIKELLKPSAYHDRYIAEIQFANDQKACGKVLLNLRINSLIPSLSIDEEWVLHATLKPISNPKNPYQFNYQGYMKNLGVMGQFEIEKEMLFKMRKGRPTLQGKAEKTRQLLVQKLKETQLHPRERSILQAMLLGDRKEVDPHLYKDYAASGAVHILAVSGLHVGILLLLLQGIFSSLNRFRWGKTIKLVIIIGLLWGYAYLVGLSSSAVRAVTMFSFLTFAQITKRPTYGINLLLLSYFFTLLIQPMELFQVGFQMSYLAVFFILWIYPHLVQLFRPKFWIFRKLWQMTAVSVAAQIGVAPLSIYYFHQFPGIFWLTNLLILPFLGLLLSYGIVVVALAAFNLHWVKLEQGLQWFLNLINEWMIMASKNEWLLFKNLSLSSWKMFALYGIIMILIGLLIQNRRKLLIGVLGSCVLWLALDLLEDSKKKASLVIFHSYRKSLIAISNASETVIWHRDSIFSQENPPLKDFLIAQNPSMVRVEKIPTIFALNGMNYNVVDSLAVYTTKKEATLIFIESPKVNLSRLIDSIAPKLIIADGSNYTSYVKRWKQTCKEKGVSFYDTSEKGAYLLEVKKYP